MIAFKPDTDACTLSTCDICGQRGELCILLTSERHDEYVSVCTDCCTVISDLLELAAMPDFQRTRRPHK